MARKYKPKSRKENSIKEILSSKGLPKSPFTKAEQAKMALDHEQLVNELAKREFDKIADSVFKPWIDLSAAVKKVGQDSPLAKKAMEDLRQIAGPPPPPLPHIPPRLVELPPPPIPSLCDKRVMQGPYPQPLASIPKPLKEEVGAVVVPGDPDSYRTTSRLVVPSSGALSLGVGNGLYPALLNGADEPWLYPLGSEWKFGDSRGVSAHILYRFDAPEGNPLGVPMTVEVTIKVIIGSGLNPHPYVTLPGPSSLVGVKGELVLTLYGSSSLGPPRSNSFKFLDHMQSQDWSATPKPYTRNFSLSGTLGLAAGTTRIIVGISAFLDAYRIDINKPAGGFSGVDLTLGSWPSYPSDPPPSTHPIYPWSIPPGGPIQIVEMSIKFCPLEFIPGDMFRMRS